MNVAEEVLQFACGNDSLLGVLSMPASLSRLKDTAVVVIVGGPQYRAGSHRQFVALARRAAAAGFATLRFDYRGMGDSTGAKVDFESVSDDIGAALQALRRRLPTVRRIVLWGLCDGASAALLYIEQTHDATVAGLCLLNPWTRSADTLARTRVKHYYLQRVLQPAFWAKLFSGQVAVQALSELTQTLRLAQRSTGGSRPSDEVVGYRERMARGWRRFEGPILLILSGRDFTAKEFAEHAGSDPAWQGCLELPRVQRLDIERADHTFSDLDSQRGTETATLRWLDDAVAMQPLRPAPAGIEFGWGTNS